MFMCMKYGGVARKQAIIEFNGIYNNTLNALNDMVCDRIEKKWVNSITPNDTPLKYLWKEKEKRNPPPARKRTG